MSLNLKPEVERDCNTCRNHRQARSLWGTPPVTAAEFDRRVDCDMCVEQPYALPYYEPDEEIVCKNHS